MSKILPKGHLSCLSSGFRYTPAMQTNIANTFARIKRELAERSEARTSEQEPRIEVSLVPRSRLFSTERVEAAWQILRAGGLRPMPRLITSNELLGG
jgi:hypothetical protein